VSNISASGKKQIASHALIIKTVREKDIVFKLDDPVSEVFSRMRKVSQEVLKTLVPHPYYLRVSTPTAFVLPPFCATFKLKNG